MDLDGFLISDAILVAELAERFASGVPVEVPVVRIASLDVDPLLGEVYDRVPVHVSSSIAVLGLEPFWIGPEIFRWKVGADDLEAVERAGGWPSDVDRVVILIQVLEVVPTWRWRLVFSTRT